MSDNLRGAMAMVASMLAFLMNDTLMKLTLVAVPPGQAIFLRGCAAVALVALGLWWTGGWRMMHRLRHPAVIARSLAEVVATAFFIVALSYLALNTITSILLTVPLLTTALAALLMREQVGWRRWTATVVGFVGVLLIVRPDQSGLSLAVVLALISAFAAASRDLLTRHAPKDTPLLMLSFGVAILVTTAGFVMVLASGEPWVWPTQPDLLRLGAASVMLVTGYTLVAAALRSGEISFVAPFRYTILIWALLSSWLFWRQLPDALGALGMALIVGAGLYSLWRERLRQRLVQARP